MPRRHHYRRFATEHELDMTTFLNLMVVLVPFLLITAVFSRITIVELNLPSSTGGAAKAADPDFRVEVIVRDKGMEITNGSAVIAKVPKVDDEYDLKTLTKLVTSLKRDHPDAHNASVLLEPNIAYDNLIHVMDAVRSVDMPGSGDEGVTQVALFPDISIGDAP